MSGEISRPGEHMIRAWVNADLGNHISAAAIGPEHAHLLEESIVAFGHEVFELGREWQKSETDLQTGKAYIRGVIDTIKIFTGEA